MRLRLTSRMRAGYAIMSMLLLAGGLVTVLYTYRIQNVTANLLAHNVMNLQAAESLELAVDRTRGMTRERLLGDAELRGALQTRRHELAGLIERTRADVTSPPQVRVLRDIDARFHDYELHLDRALAQGEAGETAGGIVALADANRAAGILYELCGDFERAAEDLISQDLGQIEAANQTVRIAMYGLGLGGLLLGYLLSLAISRSLTAPITELVLKVRGATGDELVERVEMSAGAELEELDGHVRNLIQRIEATRADLDKSRRLLQRSERLAALGRVSAGVAHEIRNPLTSIKMLIYSMTEDETVGDEHKRDLAVIAKEIDRIDRFVDNFLKFARPPDPKLEPVELGRIAHETAELLMPRIRDSRVRLIENYEDGPGTCLADPGQIRQVIMNLALNSLDAMPDGGTLTLETGRSAAADGQPGGVQVRVRDSGRGIPAAIRESLFDPFVSGRPEGAGLGLSISYQIVQQHGGWIDAVDNPGGGTTVIVNLPDREGLEHAEGARSGRRGERPLLVSQDPA